MPFVPPIPLKYLIPKPILSIHQETIFIADGGEDYRRACEISGEPLITSMIPQEEDRSLPIIEPYVKTLVGPPRSHSTFEVIRYIFKKLSYMFINIFL